jgi:uncharacterized protein involved in exopolysaccharide biosynthesis
VNGVPSGPQATSLDLGAVLPIIGRMLRSKSFIGVVLVGLLLTGVRAYLSRPVYRSEVVLLYQDRGGSNPLAQRDAPSPRRIGLTLHETLFSHALLEKLISEFGLYADTVARMGMVPAVEEMQRHDLRFEGREGYTFRISFESIAPDLAQMVTARAGELLMRAQLDARAEETKETNLFLEGERARVEKELRKDEGDLALFVAQHPEVVELDGLRGGVLSSDSPAADSASLGIEMQALQLRERLAQLRQPPSQPSQSPNAGAPREVTEARLRAEAEVAAAQHELAERQAQFTEKHPDVKRAAARLASARANLRHLDESVTAATSRTPPAAIHPPTAAASTGEPPEARVVQEQLELLEKQVRAVRSHSRRPRLLGGSDPVALARLRAQYTELERRARESRDHHDLLENRQFQAEMQALFATQAKRGDLVVVDPAYRPVVPVRSARLKIIAVGAAGTFFLAVVLSLLLVLRDDRLRHAADLRRFRLPALLCEVPPP